MADAACDTFVEMTASHDEDRAATTPQANDGPLVEPDEEVILPDAHEGELRIGAGSALSFAAKIIGLGTSFVVGVLVARVLGVEGKGTLAVIVQVPSLLLVVLDLGITTSMIYFVSRGELRPGTAAANAMVMSAVLGLAGAPVIYLLLSGPLAIVSGIPTSATVLAICILPLGLFSAWIGGISAGLGDLRLPLACTIASACTTLVGLGLLLATDETSVSRVLAISVAASAVGIAVMLLGLRRRLRPLSPDLRAVRRTARFSAKAYLSGVAGLLHERQDVLILGWLAGVSAVGLYSVGVSFAELTWYVPSALGTAILAKGSRRSEESAVDYTTRTTRVAILFMLVTIAVSVVVVPRIIPVIYGEDFAPAALTFYALIPGILADGVSRVLWSYQTTRGRLYWQYAVSTTVLNLVAVLVLAPRFGAVGAGLASSISYSALSVLVVRRFCADTGARLADTLVPQRADVEVIWRTVKSMVRPAGGAAP